MRLAFIAYDAPNYYPGPLVNMRRLLPQLRKRGHDVCLLVFYYQNDAPTGRKLQQEGIDCRFFPWTSYTERYIKWILKELVDFNPDVFVPNLSVAGYYASRWIREAGIPTIAVHRNDDDFHWGMVDQFVMGSQAWLVSGLVCVSHGLYRRVNDLKPQHTKLTVIPSGVPIPSQTCQETETLKIVYVGRLVQKQKRIIDVLCSLQKVIHELPTTAVTIIGDGLERPRLERMVDEMGLQHKITFKGSVKSEDIQNLLLEHNIIVLLSDYEGTPGAIMDGMACGLIPVCLEISGGLKELVIHEKTGFLVSNRDKQVIDVIKKLNENRTLLKRISIQARNHIVKHYSLSDVTDRWENFCQKLLSESSNRRDIKIPKRLDLPPIHPGLAREFIPRPPLSRRIFGQMRSYLVRIKA